LFARPETHTPLPFDVLDIDARSDAELDALPFGVIALDPQGIILRYNLYESRFARLDRNQVIGRRFFEEVAPCTRTDAFEGRFRTFVTSDSERGVERFDYVFDFKFGAQHVMVEIVRAPRTDRYYLLVNRTRIEGPRKSATFPAPLQTELAPGEIELGVLRDAVARRYVHVPAAFFASLRTTCERLAPDSWPIFASEWGVQLGRRIAIDLEAGAIESGDRGLASLPMHRVTEEVGRFFAERGFGMLRFDYARAREGVVVVTVERSALAESAPKTTRTTMEGAGDLACHLLAGAVGGIFSHVAGKRLASREVSCRAAGHDTCAFTIVGESRAASIDRALEEGFRGVSVVVERASAVGAGS